jgi:hypothetical protein
MKAGQTRRTWDGVHLDCQKKVHPMLIARLTCSLAHWLNRGSLNAIHKPSAESIEEETGIKKQKSPRRVPVQLRLQEAESGE